MTHKVNIYFLYSSVCVREELVVTGSGTVYKQHDIFGHI